MSRLSMCVITVLALAACGEEPAIEGSLPGECTDGADNDSDGAFDCADSDCAGSPHCAPVPTTTATTTTATTTTTTTGVPTLTTTTTDPCGNATEFLVTVNWNDDGLDPADNDGNGFYDATCTGDSVEVVVCDPLGYEDWDFGMVTGGPNPWTGEDCFNGSPQGNFCHPITVPVHEPVHELFEVCTPFGIVQGQTTMLHAGNAPFATYYLMDEHGACFVFGANPGYWTGLGCMEMMW